MSIFSVLDAAAESPDEPALVVDGSPWTFRELADPVRRTMGWLDHQGLDGNDEARVAVLATTSFATLTLLYALMEVGASIVMIHPRATAVERARLLANANPDLVILDTESVGGARADSPPRPVPDERPMAVIFTSGTSGSPKGAVLSRRAFSASVFASAANLGWRPEDRWLMSLPLAHVGGFSIVLRCLAARRCVVIAPEASPQGRFEAGAVMDVVSRDRVTLLSLVPTTLNRLLDQDWRAPPSVRAILLGGAPAAPSLLAAAAGAGLPTLTTYGLTEACSQVATQRYGTPAGACHGVGEPVAGMEVRVVDERVQIRGSSLMSGYLATPDTQTFLPGGWFDTGDLGFLDDHGRLHVSGRRTDLIISGGENVYPVEVEHEVEGIEGVKAACVFGVSDAQWGERVAVAIEPVLPGAPPKDELLVDHFAKHLSAHQRPRLVAFLDHLPLTASGKLDRKLVCSITAGRLRLLPSAGRSRGR